MLEQEEQLKLQLAQLEEKLLQTLGNSQGNILENTVKDGFLKDFMLSEICDKTI